MNKSTGIVRKLDDLGRLSIPKEIRVQLKLTAKSQMEILVDGEKIILRELNSACCFCGGAVTDQYTFRGRSICKKCLRELREPANSQKEKRLK